MVRGRGRNEQIAQGLCIFQVNVGKSGSAHDAALQLAFQSGADLILIQEPWIFSDYSRRTTKTHPSFLAFAPLPDWSDRPRVMTYTRKGRGLSPFQPSTHSRDLIRVCIHRRGRRVIDCCNIYNAPIGSRNPGEGLQKLLALAERPDILAGDFNLHHSAWNPISRSDAPDGETLLSWTTAKGLFLINPPGVSTHDAGAVLDLCFTRLGPNSCCTVRQDLDCGADHRTIFSRILDESPEAPAQGRLIYSACDWAISCNTLKDLLVTPPLTNPDDEAKLLANSLSGALRTACPRSQERATGAPWWTQECAKAHREFCRARRLGFTALEERRNFGRTVKRAKREYWHKKIEGVSTVSEAYRITGWHKNKSHFHTPPIEGPNGPVITPEAKAQIFRNTLLSRHLGQLDI